MPQKTEPSNKLNEVKSVSGRKYLISGIVIVFILLAFFLTKSLVSQQIILSRLPAVKQAKGVQLTTIKNDFLVNDDTTGGCDKKNPSASMSYSGNIVVAWQDMRNGNDWDIYACKYKSDGTPITSIFRVNDDSGNGSHSTPVVATDSAGNFVVVWCDTRAGVSNIYGQRYNSQAVSQGSNFIINDDVPSVQTHIEPDVTFLPGNKFVVSWTDSRNYTTTQTDIYCQLYNLDGTKIGNNFVVNNDGQKVAQTSSIVSPDGANTFFIVWSDGRNNSPRDLFCQRYTSSGIPINSNVKVNDDTDSWFMGQNPFVNTNLNNQNIMVWRDGRIRSSAPMIWGQRYNPNTGLVGANFCINPTGKCTQSTVTRIASVGVDSAGNFNVVWTDLRRDPYATDTYIQRYNLNGDTIGSNKRVNTAPSNDSSSVLLSSASLIITQKHIAHIQSVVLWQDRPTSQQIKVMLQDYDSSCTPIGNNISIVPDAGTASQTNSQIAMNEHGNFVIVWEDKRQWGHSDVFAQRYDKNGNTLGVNIKVNDSTNYSDAMPSVAMDTSGAFIVVWTDASTYVDARKYDANGNPTGAPFHVIQFTSGSFVLSAAQPKVAVSEKGNFVVVWEMPKLDLKFPDIFGQKYTADCTPIDTLFRINDAIGNQNLLPDIGMKKDGGFIVVWQGEHYLQDNPLFGIVGQIFDSLGQKIGTNFIINDDAALLKQHLNPAIATEENGQFVVVWEDYRDSCANIYCQRFDSNPLPIGSNIKINRNTDFSAQRYPAIAISPASGNCIITWTSYQTKNMQVMAQMLDSSGNLVDTNFVVHEPSVHPCNQRWAQARRNIAANDDFFAFTWVDNRRLKGWDIYAKLIGEKISIEENPTPRIIASPNPAYKKLAIKYTISKTGTYFVSLYNVAGRQVIKQPQGKKSKGNYDAEFDISRYSSGVYFIRLESESGSTSAVQKNADKVIIFRNSK